VPLAIISAFIFNLIIYHRTRVVNIPGGGCLKKNGASPGTWVTWPLPYTLIQRFDRDSGYPLGAGEDLGEGESKDHIGKD
jgi:hypothetical protein